MPDSTQRLLTVRNLAVSFRVGYDEVTAVKKIDFELYRGETLTILGESGSGKSVSAATVMGILDCPPGIVRTGEILIDDTDLLTLSVTERRKIVSQQIAMIFQDTLSHLNPVYSVGWQIAEIFKIRHGLSRRDAWNRAVDLLNQVRIPDASRRASHYPHQFSGGQRQRVMIAMALAIEPKILIADEPTTALDVTVQSQILDLILELRNEHQMGLIMITHDLGVAAEVSDRVLVMHQGEVVEQGRVHDVFSAPQHAYTKKLLAAIPGKGESQPEERSQGHEAEVPVLRVRHLCKRFTEPRKFLSRLPPASVLACDDVGFDLYHGETLGIVGESGSGKTTLSNLLLKLLEPDSGTVEFEGKDIFTLSKSETKQLRRRFQVVFQDPFASLNPTMSVFQIIAEPWQIHQDVVSRGAQKERVNELLINVGLSPEHAERYPHEFSGGQRQRIAIARALALEPDVIICDEAVSALDVSIQAQIIELLAQLRDTHNLSYLFIAHDLPVVRELADRIIVMQSGRIVEQGSVKDIFEQPKEQYTIELLAANPIADPRHAQERRQRRGVK